MYIYAETAFHHEGDIDYLKRLISEVGNTDCQGVKFQVLPSASDFISSKHSQLEALSSYCLSAIEWEEVFEYTLSKGLDIIMMPLSVESLSLADKFKVRYLDIHSVSFYDENLLDAIQSREEKIILGIGGRTEEEIQQFQQRFSDQLEVLMLGFQSFPSELSEVRLGRIQELGTSNGNLRIGYADHSAFDSEDAIRSNEYALLLGATFFEKHVTLNEGLKRVDFESAVGIEKFSHLVGRLHFVKKHILETVNLPMFPSEMRYRDREAKLVASRDIKEGEVLSNENLALKMVDVEASYSRYQEVIGKTAKADISMDSPIPNLD